MNKTQKFISENKQRFLDELIELLKIPSVSADPAYNQDVLNTADKVAEYLKAAGADNVEVCENSGYRVVYADKIIDELLPTVLVYGHYDVHYPDLIDLWYYVSIAIMYTIILIHHISLDIY